MRIFRELHASGTTLVIVTHDINVAEKTDRIIEMLDGRISSDHLTQGAMEAAV
jgi:ABC-type lipoprotein export system ATPase subunit